MNHYQTTDHKLKKNEKLEKKISININLQTLQSLPTLKLNQGASLLSGPDPTHLIPPGPYYLEKLH